MRKGNGGIIGPLNTPSQAVAGGMWSMDEQQQNLGARQWPGTPAASVPGAPSVSFFSFTASISGTTMTVTATGGTFSGWSGNFGWDHGKLCFAIYHHYRSVNWNKWFNRNLHGFSFADSHFNINDGDCINSINHCIYFVYSNSFWSGVS